MTGIDIAVNAVDNASKIIEGVGGTSTRVAQSLEKNWLKVTLVAGAAGIAIEAMARKQAVLTEQTRKVAASLDMQEGEIRNLALALSDVSTPLTEVLDLMELGRQQGLKNVEQLKEYVNFWDMVGDASGEASKVLAEAGISLRAVGIAAGEEYEALAAFGYIFQETTSSISDFLRFLQMTGPELRAMGASINDAAAILGILEQEFGLAGRRGIAEFRQAVNESGGDLDRMLSLLGISKDLFNEYSLAVENSSEVIARNAKIHEESFTVLQKLQSWAADLTYKYGDLITVLSSLAPILMVIGPLFKAIAVAKTLASIAMDKLTISTRTYLITIGSFIAIVAAAAFIADWLDKLSDKLAKVNYWLGQIVRLIYPLSEFIHQTKLMIDMFKGLMGGTLTWENLKVSPADLEKTIELSKAGVKIGTSGAGGTWQYGGTVPGPIGKPRLAIVHGGEEISSYRGESKGLERSIIVENNFDMRGMVIREKTDIDEITEGIAIKVKQKLAGVGVR